MKTKLLQNHTITCVYFLLGLQIVLLVLLLWYKTLTGNFHNDLFLDLCLFYCGVGLMYNTWRTVRRCIITLFREDCPLTDHKDYFH